MAQGSCHPNVEAFAPARINCPCPRPAGKNSEEGTTVSATRRLQQNYLGTLLTLVLQFLLGMAVNLFVKIPTDHPGSNPPEYFSGVVQSVAWAVLHGPLLLTLHAALGIFLVFFAVDLLVRAIRIRARSHILTAAFGAFGVIGAGFNGGSYLNYHEDFSSMIMSAGFAVAVTSYAIGLYVAHRAASPSEESAEPRRPAA